MPVLCVYCDKNFKNTRGLKIHQRKCVSSDGNLQPVSSSPLTEMTNSIEEILKSKIGDLKEFINKQIDEKFNCLNEKHNNVLTSLQQELMSSKLSNDFKDKEINYLKSELLSKNEIIRLLSPNIPPNHNKPHQPPQFIQSKDRANSNSTNQPFKLPLLNRFSVLTSQPEQHHTHIPPTNTQINNNSQPTYVQKTPKKRVTVFADSMTQRISFKEFNRHTPEHQTSFNTFRGANSKSMQYYVEPTLESTQSDICIIHCGTNDISPRPNTSIQTDDQITNEIKKIGDKCKGKKVDKIIISGIIPRADPYIDSRRKSVNILLKNMCQENGFIFLDNSNIAYNQLWRDGIHLAESGTITFANNMINMINQTNQS